MSKALALLSGKGGSGKTTLALSLASMLSECCVKVVLIDCDMSTNGATYFYEEKLNERAGEIGSFYNTFVKSNENKVDNMIRINEYMDFMPSIVKITKTSSGSYRFDESDLQQVKIIDSRLRERYDVIIYDCQAGYTDVLKMILPFVDVNLVVMEADAISSASIRSLYLKIGDLINEKKAFQIFNKATDDEYEIYSKISGGTVFTNIETVMFDWKIRKAFSVAQIPDMERTSARFGEQIYNICSILFTEDKILERLKKIDINIKLNKYKEEDNQLENQLLEEKNNRRTRMDKLVKTIYSLTIPLFVVAFFLTLITLLDRDYSGVIKENTIVIVILLTFVFLIMAISIISLSDITKDRRERLARHNIIIDRLRVNEFEEDKLQQQLDRMEIQMGKTNDSFSLKYSKRDRMKNN